MVFSSLPFLFLFLPAFLVVYFSTSSIVVRNVVLVVSSLIFYAWGQPIWVIFLLGSGIVDYWNGRLIEHFRDSPLKILGLLSTLVFNLGLLATFKYSGFIVDNVNAVLSIHLARPSFMLPVGMSFYTFETISYTLDVYRGQTKAQRSLLNFLVFICAFPRLVAGPIIRYHHVANEIVNRRSDARDWSYGVTRFCRGLCKKVFFANVAGQLTKQFFDSPMNELTLAGAWFGLLMFTLQIYYDFSGYSDMAIGLGRIVGFTYPENFNHPYIATSITDFWRRWHISMGQFFRDYVYIPLGGNRKWATRNIFVVWAVTGLWHGANWNFVLWGLYFGVLVYLEKIILLKWLGRLPAIVGHIYALSFIVMGWAIFHDTDLHRLGQQAQLMFGWTGAALYDYRLNSALVANALWLAVAVILCAPVREWVAERVGPRLPPTANGLVAISTNMACLAVSVTLLVGTSYNPFIYFRF
jgi:alginate O-acetyltransferase complex protein AlgI